MVVAGLIAVAAMVVGDVASAQDAANPPARPRPTVTTGKAAPKQPRQTQVLSRNKVVIQVSDSDPKQINLALNNARNVVEYYASKGETVDIEIVAFGPGLHMLRSDTSPVKQRIAEMSLETPSVSFVACGNTQVNMAKQEGKDIPLISEARVVPSGVIRIIELQKSGYAYLRP